jgi:serine protease AprX
LGKPIVILQKWEFGRMPTARSFLPLGGGAVSRPVVAAMVATVALALAGVSTTADGSAPSGRSGGLRSLGLAAADPAAVAASTRTLTRVVVMAGEQGMAAARAATGALGGHITRDLTLIDGFAAELPAVALPLLAAVPGVRSVTPDHSAHPMSIAPELGYDPTDTGSLSSVTRITRAQDVWARGWTGAGVDVAVIDTGVAPVPGLDAAGKVLTGPDLSLDSPGAPARGLDAYGHGTFMAGLIAGRDAGVTKDATGCSGCLNSSGYSDPTHFVGVAPDARIVNVKVGAADGTADVSQIIAAIDWVVQHAHDSGVNIRVLNLSFGTDTVQAYDKDPLAQAAEQAWKHGVVVVVAAGNDGRGPRKLADPAYDPYVIAAGADDPSGTLATADDVVPDWAQHGTEARPVDVIAPAAHVIGLRVPGSFVDTLAGNTGQVGSRFQRGSGTSQASAIVAGAAALLVQEHPDATPDQIKALLDTTGALLPKNPKKPQNAIKYSGHGVLDVSSAASATVTASSQTWASSGGGGKLDKTRAGEYLADNGVNLTGEKDIFGHAFDSAAMAVKQASATAWTGGSWNGNRWTGDGWTPSGWVASDWTGNDWAGHRWSTGSWSATTWDGHRWSGAGWSGHRWSGDGWTGACWSSVGWS